jgi:hypothetical protein
LVPLLAITGTNAYRLGALAGTMAVAGIAGFLFLGFVMRSATAPALAYARLVFGAGILAWSSIGTYLEWSNTNPAQDASNESPGPPLLPSAAPVQLPPATSPASRTPPHRPPPPAPRDGSPIAPHSATQSAPAAQKPADNNAVAGHAALAARLQEMAANAMTRSIAIQHDLQAIGLPSIFKAENLVSAWGITESREKIRRAQELINGRNLMWQAYENETRELLRAANAGAVRQYDAANEGTRKGYLDYRNAQADMLTALTDLVNFAEKYLGNASLLNGELVFPSQSMLDEFRSIGSRIKRAAANEEAMRIKLAQLQEASRHWLMQNIR